MNAPLCPIAIVGRGCVLPGALDPDTFGRRVLAGHDLVTATPEGRWGVPVRSVLGTGDGDHTRSARGGYVTGFDEAWSPEGFAVSAAELQGLDDLSSWLLHAGRQALDGVAHAGARSTTIVGNLSYPTPGLYRWAAKAWSAHAPRGPDHLGVADADPRDRFMSGLPVLRLARALGLDGPAFALDAACASALYALTLGVERLAAGEVDVALVGAGNRADDLFLHVGFSALQALSPSGRSRPFHADADGLLPCEGAVLLALKRLDDAVADGDRIHGVVRGVGLANDGRSGGALAPSAAGQVAAMRQAHAAAGITASDLGLLECHATGTPVGDRVELESATAVLDGGSVLPIGSVKSNLGHPITAAGGAALLKVLAGLEAGVRPPTLHVDRPTDALADLPLRLVTSAEAWTGPRRAGVSAFGFGGNDAHVVVEAPDAGAPRVRPVAVAPEPVVVVGVGARVGRGVGVGALAEQARRGGPTRCEEIVVDVADLRTPPRDLQATLPQQLLVLEAAREALAATSVDPARTAVLVGMGADAEVARYGVRWRLVGEAPEDRDDVVPRLTSAGVIGAMPNMPANRIQAWLDARGPGFTLSAEEGSGLAALDLARRWLVAGRVDAVVVAAVDLAHEPGHTAAARALGDTAPCGDAAVALVLKTAARADADGDRRIARFAQTDAATPVGPGGVRLEDRLGKAHAAWGLVQVVAAIACLGDGDGLDGHPLEAVEVTTEVLGGAPLSVGLVREDAASPWSDPPTPVQPLVLAAHAPPVVWPDPAPRPWREAPHLPRITEAPPVTERPAPPIAATAPPMGGPRPPRPSSARGAARGPVADAARELATAHAAFLTHQQEAHARFLALRRQASEVLVAARHGRTPPRTSAATAVRRAPPPAPSPRPTATPPAVVAPVRPSTQTPGPAPAPATLPTAADLPGPSLDRRGLLSHSRGRIADAFGELFAEQEGFDRQVRMPEPPLLLADRLLGVDAPAGALEKGRLWTETDVGSQRWYLHEGRMPAGVMIESGQADLMLISWMGIDRLNRSERVYRLLGCELTYRGGLPDDGDTLQYEIHVDGHARHEDVRLMFFHYDCVDQDGQPRLEVRGGQAGFFTEGELEDSAGILWDPATGEHDADAPVDPPVIRCTRTAFSRDQLEAFAAGDALACFGPGWERTAAQVRPPRIQGPPTLFLDEVTHCTTDGGPWGRGHLRATQAIHPDAWFFQGHFHNDPCMPGTLMFEGCLQALAVYLTSLGVTLGRDGWRFEPVPDHAIAMRCRGQCLPSNREVVYEVFVEEVSTGPVPTVWADLLCTVDGLKAFHARRVGLRLTPAYPLAELGPAHGADDPDPEAVAEVAGMPLGRRAILATAWGRPSEAFGPMYAPFDASGFIPRLPAPPLHFMSRVTDVSAPCGGRAAGVSATVAWDVPTDAWFLDAQGGDQVPFFVMLEAALQPCGWLASWVGSIVGSEVPLFFRNLDGDITWHDTYGGDLGTLRTHTTLTRFAESAGMIIVAFDVRCTRADGEPVADLTTVFGFFPESALAAQAGLPEDPVAREGFDAPDHDARDLADPTALPPGPPLGLGRLDSLDRVTGWWPDGGVAGRGRVRVAFDVDPRAWFFRAHFFQDPVQPGSLGLEAMVKGLQAWLRLAGHAEGMAAPRFLPYVPGHEVTWTYRGQVRPEHGEVVVVVDVTDVRTSDGRVEATSTADLWCDGLRIYRAEGLTTAVVDDGAAVPDVVTAPWRTTAHEPVEVAWWDDHLGAAPVGPLLVAAACRFLPAVHHVPTAAVDPERPVVFLANHQTAMESVAFATRLAPALGRPVAVVAKAAHGDSWIGRLMAHVPEDAARPALLRLVHRGDAGSTTEVVEDLRDELAAGRIAVLVHVEGTRAVRAGAPLGEVGASWLDLAAAVDAQVVPVRFTGGLPQAPVPHKADLPVGVGPTGLPWGLGAQEAWLGVPRDAVTLAAEPLHARKAWLRDALGRVGPPRAEEAPVVGDRTLEARAIVREGRTEVDPVLAVLVEVLRASAMAERAAALLDAVDAPSGAPPSDDAAVAALAAVLRGTTDVR